MQNGNTLLLDTTCCFNKTRNKKDIKINKNKYKKRQKREQHLGFQRGPPP
jgi:hypothetical protein